MRIENHLTIFDSLSKILANGMKRFGKKIHTLEQNLNLANSLNISRLKELLIALETINLNNISYLHLIVLAPQ